MRYFEIISIIQILATLAVGFILWQRIKHQDKIIDSYKSVFESTDISRLIKYYEQSERLIKQNMLASFVKISRDTIQQNYEKIGRQYDEMANFIDSLYSQMPEQVKKDLIKNRMPNCSNLFPLKEKTLNESAHSG